MGTIVSLSGCRAVGKTTLINNLQTRYPQLYIREGFRKTDTGFRMCVKEEYYMNERWYIQREIEEYQTLKKMDSNVLLLRGAEDLAFFAVHYPRIHGYSWNVEEDLHDELQALKKCQSDGILYLDADVQTILRRKESDKTKDRTTMEDWLLNWQPYLDAYIKSFPYTTVLKTDNMSETDVFTWTIEWLEEFWRRREIDAHCN